MSKLKQGEQAPEFSLPDQNGNNHSLAEQQGHLVLVYFYPKADTPGCTTQACAIRDALDDLLERGIKIFGISPDKPEKQAKFDSKYSLGFPLLADTEHRVAEAYGVWGEKKFMGRSFMGIIRSAFLIDAKGRIRCAWYKVSPEQTVPNVLEELNIGA